MKATDKVTKVMNGNMHDKVGWYHDEALVPIGEELFI